MDKNMYPEVLPSAEVMSHRITEAEIAAQTLLLESAERRVRNKLVQEAFMNTPEDVFTFLGDKLMAQEKDVKPLNSPDGE